MVLGAPENPAEDPGESADGDCDVEMLGPVELPKVACAGAIGSGSVGELAVAEPLDETAGWAEAGCVDAGCADAPCEDDRCAAETPDVVVGDVVGDCSGLPHPTRHPVNKTAKNGATF